MSSESLFLDEIYINASAKRKHGATLVDELTGLRYIAGDDGSFKLVARRDGEEVPIEDVALNEMRGDMMVVRGTVKGHDLGLIFKMCEEWVPVTLKVRKKKKK